MRLVQIALAASFLSFAGRADEEAVSTPRFDRIDYSRPQDYLALHKSLGNPEHVRKIAAALEAESPERTLIAIGHWIDTNLKCDNAAAYCWRDFDQVVDSNVYGGCADHSLVFGALARACGIPTVWVKTMDSDWIREFRAKRTCESWRGHVFLEVYLGGRWRLLDATNLRLHDDYDPATRILPGNRYAYDKGGEPRQLILSLDWERWKRQTAAYFSSFDLANLPMGEGRALGAVYAAANSPVWQAVSKRMRDLGHSCFSFNTDFERYLELAKGADLIITCVGDRPVLPEKYRAQYLPEELRSRMKQSSRGVIPKKMDDGTRLFLLYGKTVDEILEVIPTLRLESRQ
jgi:hypothetical protein